MVTFSDISNGTTAAALGDELNNRFNALKDTVNLASGYDISRTVNGAPAASATVARYIAARPLSFAASLAPSVAKAAAAATASTTFSIAKNGTQFGTMVFAAAGTSATFTGTATTFAAGDLLTIVAPATADATLADIAITLSAVLV